MYGPFYGVFHTVEAYSQYLRWLNMELKDGKIRAEQEGRDTGGSGGEREGRTDRVETDRPNTPVALRVITGGRDGSGSGDWLTPLDKGVIFLAKEKGKEHELIPFCIADDRFKAKRLTVNYPDGTINTFWVDPIPFCRRYSFYEQIGQFFNEEDHNESG